MKRLPIFFAAAACALANVPAAAEQIRHMPDPAYRLMNAQDVHPMSEIAQMAEDGDVRAQFIMGDLLSKGKGGYPRNLKKAADWFERAARQGYNPALIRLAAVAKERKKPVDAYMWYSLALERSSHGKLQKFLTRARADLVRDAEMTEADRKEARAKLAEWKRQKPAAQPEKQTKAGEKQTAEKAARLEPRAGGDEIYGPVKPEETQHVEN